MTVPLIRSGILVLVASLALVAALQLAPDRRPTATSAYLLLLGAVALRLLVRVVGLAHPPAGRSELDAVLDRRPGPPETPAELASLGRMLALASASGVYVHTRLRPEVRQLAADLLAWRQGVDLDAEPEAARAALGEVVWDLVRPDRQEPTDQDAPGLPAPVLATMVADLEAVRQR